MKLILIFMPFFLNGSAIKKQLETCYQELKAFDQFHRKDAVEFFSNDHDLRPFIFSLNNYLVDIYLASKDSKDYLTFVKYLISSSPTPEDFIKIMKNEWEQGSDNPQALFIAAYQIGIRPRNLKVFFDSEEQINSPNVSAKRFRTFLLATIGSILSKHNKPLPLYIKLTQNMDNGKSGNIFEYWMRKILHPRHNLIGRIEVELEKKDQSFIIVTDDAMFKRYGFLKKGVVFIEYKDLRSNKGRFGTKQKKEVKRRADVLNSNVKIDGKNLIGYMYVFSTFEAAAANEKYLKESFNGNVRIMYADEHSNNLVRLK